MTFEWSKTPPSEAGFWFWRKTGADSWKMKEVWLSTRGVGLVAGYESDPPLCGEDLRRIPTIHDIVWKVDEFGGEWCRVATPEQLQEV